ncbi:NUDIX domain-containing protein [Teredinibacter purpureus]|jgi:nudix-type nucleoside diphosphatase, YffH/AdpP family|uniref:NUDIX domain-containing protein n=1 Tax=Teredinibacter purpureus TaxID=2731756 RepID=UPI0005F7D919
MCAPAELGKDDFTIEKDETVYDGFFKMYKLQLRHKTFAGEWIPTINRELFHRGEAAAAILYDPKRHLIGLIEQFRVGALESEYGPWCLETVAGMMEEGETPEGLIRRELEEEAGITHTDVRHISSYYSSPGGCSEKIHLYCALCDLEGKGGLYGLAEENEDIRFAVYNAEDVFSTMFAGRTNNAATLIGLQWIQFNQKALQAEAE